MAHILDKYKLIGTGSTKAVPETDYSSIGTILNPGDVSIPKSNSNLVDFLTNTPNAAGRVYVQSLGKDGTVEGIMPLSDFKSPQQIAQDIIQGKRKGILLNAAPKDATEVAAEAAPGLEAAGGTPKTESDSIYAGLDDKAKKAYIKAYQDNTDELETKLKTALSGFGGITGEQVAKSTWGDPAAGILGFLSGLGGGNKSKDDLAADKLALSTKTAEEKAAIQKEKAQFSQEQMLRRNYQSQVKGYQENIDVSNKILTLVEEARVLEKEKKALNDKGLGTLTEEESKRLSEITTNLGQKDTAISTQFARLFEKGVLTDSDIIRYKSIGSILDKWRQDATKFLTGSTYKQSERDSFADNVKSLANNSLSIYEQRLDEVNSIVDSYNAQGQELDMERIAPGAAGYLEKLKKDLSSKKTPSEKSTAQPGKKKISLEEMPDELD